MPIRAENKTRRCGRPGEREGRWKTPDSEDFYES
jgi:hypothetical protein